MSKKLLEILVCEFYYNNNLLKIVLKTVILRGLRAPRPRAKGQCTYLFVLYIIKGNGMPNRLVQ